MGEAGAAEEPVCGVAGCDPGFSARMTSMAATPLVGANPDDEEAEAEPRLGTGVDEEGVACLNPELATGNCA